MEHSSLAGIFPPVTGEYPKNSYKQDNCSLIVNLKHKTSEKELQLIGVNVYWDPGHDYVKLAQLLNTFNEASKSAMPTVLFGDLNAR